MFGASHFQKERRENIIFWVSYSKNKFLATYMHDGTRTTIDHKLTDYRWWVRLPEILVVDYRLDNKLADYNWLQIDKRLLKNGHNNKLTCIYTAQEST